MCAAEEEKEEGGGRDTRGSLRNYSMVRYRYPVARRGGRGSGRFKTIPEAFKRGRPRTTGFQVGGAVDRRSRSGIERSLR